MKGIALLVACALISTQTLSFVTQSSLPRASGKATAHYSRRGRTLVTSQLSVTADAPRPALPPGKRIIRRRKPTPPSAPVFDVDITNAPVERIRSESDYLSVLKQSERSLVVIKFFTPWCRSCKAMDLKYRRLALQYEDVKFFEVDVVESLDLKKAMGVTAVPTVKLHAGSLGQVASFSCGPKKVPELERKINICKDVSALSARVRMGLGTLDAIGTRHPEQEQNLPTELPEIVGELIEKFRREEKLSQTLNEVNLDGIVLDSSV